MPQPGAPFPYGKQIQELVVQEIGDIAEGEGLKLSIAGNQLVFRCATDGADFLMAINLTDLLASIGQYNKANES